MIRTIGVWATVIVGWIVVTAAVAYAVPPRDDPNALPDLAYDPHFSLGTPPNPVQYDRAPSIRTEVPTTTSAEGGGDAIGTAPQATARSAPPPRLPLRTSSTPGVEQWRGLVAQYPWPVETMLAIMRCESGGNPLAHNPSGASGLFQLLPGPPGWQDPATNIRLAYEMKYVSSGLRPWDASRSCWS